MTEPFSAWEHTPSLQTQGRVRDRLAREARSLSRVWRRYQLPDGTWHRNAERRIRHHAKRVGLAYAEALRVLYWSQDR